jgi:hypothetical protein
MSTQIDEKITDIFVYQIVVQNVLREINQQDLSLRDKKIILSRAMNHVKKKK